MKATTSAAAMPATFDTRTSLDLSFAVRDLTDPRLGGRHALVLYALLTFRQKDGTFAPSADQLARATKTDRATIFRALRDLDEWGFVKRTNRGRYASALFELTLPGGDVQRSHDAPPRPLRKAPAVAREVAPCDPLRISFSEDRSRYFSSDQPPREEEQFDRRSPGVEKPEATVAGDVVAKALHAVMVATDPELLLPMVPPLSMHAAGDIAKATALVAFGMTPAMFTEAAAGALLVSKGAPSIGYVCGTLEHFQGHIRRKRERDAAETKKKQRQIAQLSTLERLQRGAEPARNEVFGSSKQGPPASASRASEDRAGDLRQAMRAEAQARAQSGCDFFAVRRAS